MSNDFIPREEWEAAERDARIRLQSEVDRLTSASIRDAEIHASLRKRVKELEADLLELAREHSNYAQRVEAEVTQLRALHAADDDMIAALQQQLSAETMRHHETAKRLEAATEAFSEFVESARYFDMEFSDDESHEEAEAALSKAQAALATIKEPNHE